MGYYDTKQYGKYTLFVGENGFYLEDEQGEMVLDASTLSGFWPVELFLNPKKRQFYVTVHPTNGEVAFGVGQRINNGNSN